MVEVSFGEWLKRRRKAQGLTQEELALQISCSASALRKIEAEQRRPSSQIVEQLAEVFNIAANERKSFLKFGRGDWRAAPTGVIESAPWLESNIHEYEISSGGEDLSDPKIHLATFLFTDIEGSAKLWESAPAKMKVALQRHHEILQEAISSNDGAAFQIVGDAFCAVFPTASSAISAALTAQRALNQEQWDLPSPIRVRIGIHTGTAERTSNDSLTGGYASNHTLNRVARILSAGHGGQVLVSLATKELVIDSLPEDTELRDMGEHHLKNLTRPEHLFQLIIADLPSDFPPLFTLDLTRHNLPLQLTSFIGRTREMAEVKYLLSATRLLTLMGPGGTGKTRLSIQIAGELLDQYPDGVWIVELAPISDPLLIPRTTAIAIGLRDEPQRPVIDMLCDYLHEKKILLILDNCEHLIEACAQLADTLLHACPHIRILATSREALGIAGETSYLVPSLQLPDMQNLPPIEPLSQYEAVRLFIERASAATQKFRVTDDNASSIAQICNRLDGIPLAIELAAGKIRALSTQQIAQHLDDRFHLLTGGNRTALPRHQTLQAAIEWSYNLLSPAEQILFRRLSVFVGGWILEAAESVCSDPDTTTKGALKSEDIREMLAQLVNKSLAMTEERHDQVRYHMLETIRQFGGNKLVEADEREFLRARHLDYFLNLAETAEPHLRRPEQLDWFGRLDDDYENLRAALEWALSMEIAELSLRLCAALGPFWNIHSYSLEGSKWFMSALSKSSQNPGAAEKAARVKALYQDSQLANNLDNLERMQASAKASLALCTEDTDKLDVAIAKYCVGNSLRRHGDDENAIQRMEESFAEFHEMKERYWEAGSYISLNYILIGRGERELSEQRLMRAIELARGAGERSNLVEALLSYSRWLFIFNRLNDARKYAEEAERLLEQIGSDLTETSFLFAQIARLNGDYQQARAIYIEAQARFNLLGEKYLESAAIENLGQLAIEQGKLDQAQAYLEQALATAREFDYKESTAYRLVKLGITFYLQGKIDKCKQYFRECIHIAKRLPGFRKTNILFLMINYMYVQKLERLVQILGALSNSPLEIIRPIALPWKRYYDRAEVHARESLGNAAFESAFAEGQKMSLDEALDLALKTVEEM